MEYVCEKCGSPCDDVDGKGICEACACELMDEREELEHE